MTEIASKVSHNPHVTHMPTTTSSMGSSMNPYVHLAVNNAAVAAAIGVASTNTASDVNNSGGSSAAVVSTTTSEGGNNNNSIPSSTSLPSVRMSLPRDLDSNSKKLPSQSSIITNKTGVLSSSIKSGVPAMPQTVTVAVGSGGGGGANNNNGDNNNPISDSDINVDGKPLLHRGAIPIITNSNNPNINNSKTPLLSTSAPPSSTTFSRRRRRKHRHLPRGLPVFKDSRSCMWTSTHDANAPSEDRYSSLVNVLLRPPKTTRMPTNGGSNSAVGSGTVRSNSGGGGGGMGNDSADGGEGEATAEGGGVVASSSNNNENVNENIENVENVNSSINKGSRSGSSCEGSISDGDDEETTAANPAEGQSQQQQQATTPSTTNEDDEDNTSLIRLSLWSVIDGHGGGCVATYAAEVLLPHIAASVARALKSDIVDRGVCNVNGQLRDANALDLDGLIRSSDRSKNVGKSQVRQREAGIDVVNPNSIHYRSPYEDSESEGDVGVDHNSRGTTATNSFSAGSMGGGSSTLRSESESEAESEAPVSVASSLLPGNPIIHGAESVSSVKTSVKTAVSPVTQHAPVGTHSPAEVAAITTAITDSFLAVDEGWINSIDPVTTHQTSCVSNGRWNAGACALVVFIVQRLDWCRSSRVDHETHHRERGARGFEDTSHNKDAARRRKLDYATKSKSVSSLSTLSSTSSITTEANTTEMLVEESEITETETEDDVSDIFGPRGRRRRKNVGHHDIDDPHQQEGVFIATPAGCKCHYYRPHDAMLYTAHVGDCRAVMLGSAPPRTIKVPPGGDSSHSLDHADTSEDESSTSVSISGEISSSDHDSDSSEELDEDDEHFMRRGNPPAGLGYVRRSKRPRRGENNSMINQPYVPLPPLSRRESSSSEESAVESDDSASTTAQEHQPPVSAIRGRAIRSRVDLVDVNRPFNNIEEEKLMETEDEEAEDEIKEIRSVRSGSPTQMDRPPSPTQLVADPPIHPPPLPLSMLMRPIDLTTDHSAYNPAEVTAVLRRCNNAPKAISSASGGGIKRVAGSLAVTRALGDAYLKTPRLSFFPYKRHAPYITARPEVNCRVLTKGADRILILASDGVWERASGDDVLRWVRNYYNARIAGVKEQKLHPLYGMEGVEEHPFGEITERISRKKGGRHGGEGAGEGDEMVDAEAGGVGSKDDTMEETSSNLTPPVDNTTATKEHATAASGKGKEEENDDGATTSETTADTTTAGEIFKAGIKRKHSESAGSVSTRSSHASSFGRGTRRHHSSRSYSESIPTVSEVIVRKVLNKVRKTRNISSLRMLMSLPKGRARRSKHDDITATVVDLSVSCVLLSHCVLYFLSISFSLTSHFAYSYLFQQGFVS